MRLVQQGAACRRGADSMTDPKPCPFCGAEAQFEYTIEEHEMGYAEWMINASLNLGISYTIQTTPIFTELT